jgi:hypothetical protein
LLFPIAPAARNTVSAEATVAPVAVAIPAPVTVRNSRRETEAFWSLLGGFSDIGFPPFLTRQCRITGVKISNWPDDEAAVSVLQICYKTALWLLSTKFDDRESIELPTDATMDIASSDLLTKAKRKVTKAPQTCSEVQ